MATKVKNKSTGQARPKRPAGAPKTTRKRDGRVKVTSQGQISIPRQAMRDAGIGPGDHLQAHVDDLGRIVLSPADNIVLRFAGTVSNGMTQAELQKMRDEWDR